MNLRSIRKYSEEVEVKIKKQSEEFIDYLEQATEGLSPEEAGFEWDKNEDKVRDLDIAYPTLLRYSIVMSTYSALEQALMRFYNAYRYELARLERIDINSKAFKKFHTYKPYLDYKKYGDKLGEGISNIQAIGLYIKDEMSIQFPYQCPEWEFIIQLTKIRNNITHSNGRIPEDNDSERLRRIMKEIGYDYIRPSMSQEIILKENFSEYMLNQVEEFLNKFLSCIKSSLQEPVK